MQAVLIAGGLGTRLRPLTYTRPKALLPLANRPMVLHVIERLPAEVDEIIIAASYRTGQLRDFFRREDVGRPVEVVRETKPLGTGGCLKNLEGRLGDTFLAFNGDVVSSLAVPELSAAHRRFGGIGTLALWEVEDPSPFGVVRMDGDRIASFVEKPPKEKAPSKLVNAGMYAFEPEIMAAIPKGKPVSLEREVFPKVLRKGLYGHRFQGYWSDAGTQETFLRATSTLLRERGSDVSRRANLTSTATLVKPVSVAADTTVAGKVGPGVAIGRECDIREARIRNSVLFDRVSVGDGAEITGSIVGEACTIGPRATVVDSILGDGATIRADARVDGERIR